MGIYLASPNKEKDSYDDNYANMKFGVSAMQGYINNNISLNY